jgi:hypothetical protein
MAVPSRSVLNARDIERHIDLSFFKLLTKEFVNQLRLFYILITYKKILFYVLEFHHYDSFQESY